MKIRLGYKIFAAFLLTCFVLVALMVGTMQFYVSRNFADYVNNKVLDRLDALAVELTILYRTNNGWRSLENNADLWESVLKSGLKKSDLKKHRYSSDEQSGEDSSGIEKKNTGTSSQNTSRKPSDRYLNRLARRLALFDREKRHIAGRDVTRPDSYTLREIVVDDRTVGWLGLYKRERLTNPLDVRFLKEQSLAFYALGVGILLLAAVVSFILTKHLLSPIRKLTEGTRALREFDFNAKIDVRTGDELGQLGSDFNRMADTLRKYEKMRRKWISDISHELRTPLAILRGEIEAMQDGIRHPGPEDLDSLHSEVTRLGRLVEDLHLLSLADSQALLFKKHPVEPFEILKEMVARYRTRLESKQIEVQLELNSSRPMIAGDSDRLAQLFVNLLENTLRYTDSPGRLKICGRSRGDRLLIDFEDSAPGVPHEALDLLFDRLYRIDKSRSRELGGSGLGLSICREIVEAHKGTIRAAVSSSGGLLIQISLPLETDAE